MEQLKQAMRTIHPLLCNKVSTHILYKKNDRSLEKLLPI